MTVTSSWRTLIPHTESKRKAPWLLVLVSLTSDSWFTECSLPEIFLILSYWHCRCHYWTLLCTHTRLLAISTTRSVLKRPKDQSLMLQTLDSVNSQSHFEAWKKAVKWSIFSYDAYRDNMHGINWRTKKKPLSQPWNSPSYSGIAVPSRKNSIWVCISESPGQK